jgi:hypothetical protein
VATSSLETTMSRSNKSRNSTRTKRWKDTVRESRTQVRSRAKWKKVTKNSPKKTGGSRVPQKPTPKKMTERELVAEGLANNATAEIMAQFMKRETPMLRKFGPKAAGHPSIGEPCPACKVPFKVGDYTALIPLGPGDDPEEQQKAREKKPYTAVAVEVHYDCADPHTPE